MSFARNSAELTADMVRETVGHMSEEVERGYYTAGDISKAKVMAVLAAIVQEPAQEAAEEQPQSHRQSHRQSTNAEPPETGATENL